jgi:ATP-dependent Clp protease ATP-binding subunit ClpX
MFDLPSLESVEEVVISPEVVAGTAQPLYIYAARAQRRRRELIAQMTGSAA